MESISLIAKASPFTLVLDDSCEVVRQLARLVKLWDRRNTFEFIGHTGGLNESLSLLQEQKRSGWSLMLIDNHVGERWYGPEAIPIILKNLPFGKMAAVAYIVPGTMWLTNHLYLLVSRNRRRLSQMTTSA